MKHLTKLFAIMGMILSTALHAQDGKVNSEKIVLICPFEHGSGREPKEAFTWDPPDKKVIMISKVDSVIRSATSGVVTNMDPIEDNQYEIVVNFQDYYFWYYGVTKPFVARGDVVKAGQSIGFYTLGRELEFRMFKFEDPIDPRIYLECKIPEAQ